eukprot:9003417-Pyramimonas_sp.AAC.1
MFPQCHNNTTVNFLVLTLPPPPLRLASSSIIPGAPFLAWVLEGAQRNCRRLAARRRGLA